jgi:23S rRNA (guanine745-N1)-methyltransferase
MTQNTSAGDTVTLLCTVRGCRQPLRREARRAVCPRGHSFDAARSGYLNLLQPQDRRSRQPGDSKEAALARRRFVERGFGAAIVGGIAALVAAAPAGAVLDVGCGDGHHLASFGRSDSHGLDISVPAIDLAARKYRHCSFVVANADRFLPYADASFAVVTSITARLQAAEFRRVLRGDGALVVALAGADDLLELREAVLGEGKLIDRSPGAIETMAGEFELVSQTTIRDSARLDRQAIDDVMTSSYRAMRTRERGRLTSLAEMDVTLSRDVLVFRARPKGFA